MSRKLLLLILCLFWMRAFHPDLLAFYFLLESSRPWVHVVEVYLVKESEAKLVDVHLVESVQN